MEKISIISLIFQSPHYADFVYDSLVKFTPELQSEAEFYFVANDATEEVKNHLKQKGYPHLINDNPFYSDEERFNMGYAYPEYCGRVYMGYNYGIRESKNPIIMWVNSDNYFSPGWLRNLKKRLTKENIVSPKIIQPVARFVNPINQSSCEVINYGEGLRTFKEGLFLNKVKQISSDSESIGCAFFPAMIYKENIERVGYFPEGNLHGGDYNNIRLTGDTSFYLRLRELGIKHITSNDSVIYHFNEGEKYLK